MLLKLLTIEALGALVSLLPKRITTLYFVSPACYAPGITRLGSIAPANKLIVSPGLRYLLPSIFLSATPASKVASTPDEVSAAGNGLEKKRG